MASLTTIAKARGTGLLLQKFFNEEPSYQYADDYVRIYYEPDRLRRVQSRIDDLTKKGPPSPGDVRIDWVPIVMPIAIKKIAPFVIGTLVAGYLIGKLT